MTKQNLEQKLEKEREKIANWRDLPDEERLKYEIADELGLLRQVEEHGWRGLSAQETGRIGGLMTRRKKLRN